ncbi:MAG TPA: cytochrome P450 [Polyangia bacterium]|jgi:cytochrome P450
MSLPPGPRGPAFLQTLEYTYWTSSFFERCARRYGDPFTVRMPGFGAFVMVSAPELIKQVFTGDPEQLHAGKANAMLEPVVGRHSVLLLDGKEHLRQRRLLLPPLHGERIQAYAALMAEIAAAEVARMPVGSSFSIHERMQAITLQVILRAVFGLDEGAQMNELAALLVEFTRPPPSLMIFVPPAYLKYGDFPLSPFRAFLRRRANVDRALRAILRAKMAAPDPSRTDILSLLLAARDEDGRAMTEDELRDELVTMLIAGHETTATTLAWVFAFILKHPEVAARLQGELEGTLRSDGTADLGKLAANEYVDAVIKEAMRLRPIIPDVVRRVQQPITVAGYDIPVGAFLTPCIQLAHRRPESWPEPQRFRPERFVGAKVEPYTWFPFGGGIRRCLGMAFALYEMKIVVGVTLLGARLRLATDDPLKVVRRGVTLAPAGGTPVVLEERRARRAAA